MAKGKAGRPGVITPELLEVVLDEIAEGSTERACFRKEGRPDWRTWCRWKRKNLEFAPRIAQANEDWCASMEAFVTDRANDTSQDVHHYEERIESEKNGLTVKTGATTDNTATQRAKLQIDTAFRLMVAKMPQRYGQKVQQELTGKDGAELTPVLNITIAPPPVKK